MNELERYELVSRIAVGGMAEVFRAKAYGAHGFEKPLAIKRILPQLAADPEFLGRFIEEAKVAVSLTHTNIVQVIDFGRFGGSLYIAMEYVDGPDLSHLLEAYRSSGKPMPFASAVYIAMEVLKGLDFAHRRGIVHRDVSPSNILVSRSGEVKVADFGIAVAADASLSIDRRVMGKWRYMSPEQAEGKRLDPRSDLFSAGSVFFEMFTGQRLFAGGTIDEVVTSLRTLDIPEVASLRSEIPPGIDEVLGRLLERDPEKRYERAADAIRALMEISFARTLMATAEDVSHVVERVMPATAGNDPTTPVTGGGLIDDIIASELSEQNEASGPPVEKTWRTERTGSPAPVTFIPGRRGADGFTQWQTAAEKLAARSSAVAAVPAPVSLTDDTPMPAGAIWPWLLVPVILAVLAGAAWLVVDTRVKRPMALAPDAAPLVDASPDATTIATPDAPPSIGEATLVVRSEPPGAEVFLDGRGLGRTPLEGARVPADGSRHELRLELAGHLPHTETLVLEPGGHFHLRPELTRRTEPARPKVHDIYIWSDPWAEVYLGGKKVGETQGPVSLPEGKHRLTLRSLDDRKLTLSVTVPSRDAYRVKIP